MGIGRCAKCSMILCVCETSPQEIVAMARAAQRDDRLSTGALYGQLADEIERLRHDVERYMQIANDAINGVAQTPAAYPDPTPAMVSAGIDAFNAWDERDDFSIKNLVRQIFHRMTTTTNHGDAQTENWVRLSASEAACYRWPDDTAEHKALRAAYMDGAASVAAQTTPVGDVK